jgi:hypothetical protein
MAAKLMEYYRLSMLPAVNIHCLRGTDERQPAGKKESTGRRILF